MKIIPDFCDIKYTFLSNVKVSGGCQIHMDCNIEFDCGSFCYSDVIEIESRSVAFAYEQYVKLPYWNSRLRIFATVFFLFYFWSDILHPLVLLISLQ